MKISQKGIDLIKFYEQCRLKAYKCPSGIWTIGWGHTQEVKEKDVWTQKQADDTLISDLEEREDTINDLGLKLNQNQFDALVSLVYNIGAGNFRHSPVRAQVLADPNHPWIKVAFLKHVYANGSHDGIDNDNDGLIDEPGEVQKLPGLIARRNKEVQLYFS